MCNISASHKRGKLITQSSRLRPNTFACVSRVCESTSRGGVETLRYSRCRLYFQLGLDIYICTDSHLFVGRLILTLSASSHNSFLSLLTPNTWFSKSEKMKFTTLIISVLTLALGVSASCRGDCKIQCGYGNNPSAPCPEECIGRCIAYHCPPG